MKTRYIKKIMLIQPPSMTVKGQRQICQPPLGLGYISANLNPRYEVEVLDSVVEGYDYSKQIDNDHIIYGLPFSKIREKIVKYQPDVVGISMQSTAFYLNGLAIAKMVKYISKDIIVIVGGAYPSSNQQEAMENSTIDYIIIGEGDESFSELVDAIYGGKSVEQIDGLCYRNHIGEICTNPKTKFIRELDRLKFPISDKLNMKKYFDIKDAHMETRTDRAIQMITSRGCPNDCSFCTIHDVWGYCFRYRSAENVMKEIEYLREKYGITEIQFEDDNLAYDYDRAITIFKELKNYNLLWSLPNGISIKTLSGSMLETMKESGCYSISLPFESANQKTLKEAMHKYVDLDAGKKAASDARKIGIETYGFFIVGFPNETLDDVYNTLEFSSTIDLNGIYVFYATPFPGTQLLKSLKENGYLDSDFNPHNLTIQRPTFGTENFTTEQLRETVESFIDRKKKEGCNYL